MALTPLVGNEVLYVIGTSQNGSLAPRTFEATTAEMAGAPISSTTVSATATAVGGKVYLLNAASGSKLTLPAATGTGARIKVIVSTTVTSNAHKILAASTSDFMQGMVLTELGGTVTGFNAALSATYCSVAMNGAGTGGFQGDEFDLVDIAANTWQVNGVTKCTTSAATPFSTSDT